MVLDPFRRSQFRPSDYAGIAALAEGLEKAWNLGDADVFASYFTPDADVVAAYGANASHHANIARQHRTVFRSSCKDSTVRFRLSKARFPEEDLAVVHLQQNLHVPWGTMAGGHDAIVMMVLVRQAGTWSISTFQSTWVSEQPSFTATLAESAA